MTSNYGVKGTDLQFTVTTGSTVLTTVGSIQKIDGPGMKVGKRDVTKLLSGAKEYAPSIGDPQEFSGSLVYYHTDPAVVGLFSRCNTPVAALDNFKIILPTTTKFFQFDGFFTSGTPKGGDVEGTWMVDFSIQPSGTITYPTTT